MKKAIIGAGGFGREVKSLLLNNDPSDKILFFVEDMYANTDDLPLSAFDSSKYQVLVAIANPIERNRIVNSLPADTVFFNAIHKSVQFLDPTTIKIGLGCVICSNVVLTTNVTIGDHCHLNLLTTIGHDTIVGDFFTTAPGAKISGNCSVGDRVYVGTNASIREKLTIVSDVTIGLGAGVVKDIDIPGIYGGIPAVRIK